MTRQPLLHGIALLACTFAAAAHAQTTGTLVGTVADGTGQPLPGVTVEATSPAQQGVGVAVAGIDGAFRLDFLAPGAYHLRFSLDGFSPVEQDNVVVGLGRTVTLLVRMADAMTEEVLITGAPPAVDLRSVEVGANIASDFFLTLPTERNYISVVQAAPGTGIDKAGTTVYGSTGAENAYYIDDINTTGVWRGLQLKALNVEFVQEVQLKSGGYAAEFGRSTGGVVNVITKSGGDTYHGDVFGYYFSDAMQSARDESITSYLQANSGASYVGGFVKSDLGGDVGGFLVKDRLWFFAAFDAVANVEHNTVAKDFSVYGGPPQGKVYDTTTQTRLWSGKLTGRPADGHSLVLTAFGDPADQEGPRLGSPLNGAESTFLGTFDYGGTNAALKYLGVLGESATVEGLAGHHSETAVNGGDGIDVPLVVNYTTPQYAATRTTYRSGGYGTYSDQASTRDAVRASATVFVRHFAGDHEIKGGGEAERLRFEATAGYTGGQTISILCAKGKLTLAGCAPEWVYYAHGVRLSAVPPGGVSDPNLATYVLAEMSRDTTWRNDAAFVQDAWRPSPRLTLNLGVRWERQLTYDFNQKPQLALDDQWSPRLGVVWDVRGDGRAKAFASWGRFYETVPLSVSRTFANFISATVANLDPVAVSCDPALQASTQYNRCVLSNPSPEPVDPNGVKGQYVDEWVVGGELTVGSDLVLGARVLSRDLGRVIEDSASPTGYFLGNPGYGELATALDQTQTWTYAAGKPKRQFLGAELTARRRLADRWQLLASYLWSRLRGNYDGMIQLQTGQMDPNLNSSFDYAEFQVNNDGYLANDRRHQLKVSASYTFAFGLDLGASAYLRTGTPVTAMGWNDSYRSPELYLSQRGDWDRTATEYEASLHLGYPIRFGGVEVNLLADVFNLLDRQGETARNQVYTTAQVLDVLDYSTGAPRPAIANGTACASLVSAANAIYCNPAFNTSNAWQDPRSVRLGIRVTF